MKLNRQQTKALAIKIQDAISKEQIKQNNTLTDSIEYKNFKTKNKLAIKLLKLQEEFNNAGYIGTNYFGYIIDNFKNINFKDKFSKIKVPDLSVIEADISLSSINPGIGTNETLELEELINKLALTYINK